VELLSDWPAVVSNSRTASLVVAGKGPLEDFVRKEIEKLSSASLELDPTRDDIHRILRSASVLVLPSKRTASWREQVGLPIVEGLSHGTEVVTTRETGLAAWLQMQEHHIIESMSDLAPAIVDALSMSRSAGDVCTALPQESGRMAAARWLWWQADPANSTIIAHGAL
jgi:hypothetical protein